MENRVISWLFRLAKKHLAMNEKEYVTSEKTKFICLALSRIKGVAESEVNIAKFIVINKLEGQNFAEDWLMSKGIPNEDFTLDNIQLWRHKWLDKLIEEFDVPGTYQRSDLLKLQNRYLNHQK